LCAVLLLTALVVYFRTGLWKLSGW